MTSTTGRTDDARATRPPVEELVDPPSMEANGVQLAHLLRAREPTVVLTWEAATDLVLAHVVARELGATLVRCYDSDGLAAFAGRLPVEGRAALVGVSFARSEAVRAMTALAEQQHLQVVAAGALVDGSAGVEELARREIPFVTTATDTGAAHV